MSTRNRLLTIALVLAPACAPRTAPSTDRAHRRSSGASSALGRDRARGIGSVWLAPQRVRNASVAGIADSHALLIGGLYSYSVRRGTASDDFLALILTFTSRYFPPLQMDRQLMLDVDGVLLWSMPSPGPPTLPRQADAPRGGGNDTHSRVPGASGERSGGASRTWATGSVGHLRSR